MLSSRKTLSNTYKLPITQGQGKVLFTLLFSTLLCTCGLAQRDQIIPPFLQKSVAPQTVELEGRTFVVPNFSISPFPHNIGNAEFVTRTPMGYLAVRDTDGDTQVVLRRFRDVFRAAEFFESTPNPLLVTAGIGRTINGPVFDFAQTAPHLAFFCRLEINELKGNLIPAKFRLGGHRYWQDNLLRRD